jgi:hypothetical protein
MQLVKRFSDIAKKNSDFNNAEMLYYSKCLLNELKSKEKYNWAKPK